MMPSPRLSETKPCGRCGKPMKRRGATRYHPECAGPKWPIAPGAKAQCKRCLRLFKRRSGRQFCMVCSGSRLSTRLRRELARNPTETP
jgi:hypothetical protein